MTRTPELFGSSTFLNTTRRLSEPGQIKVKTQVTVSVCLADWGFSTALTTAAFTVTLMVAIGPSSLVEAHARDERLPLAIASPIETQNRAKSGQCARPGTCPLAISLFTSVSICRGARLLPSSRYQTGAEPGAAARGIVSPSTKRTRIERTWRMADLRR